MIDKVTAISEAMKCVKSGDIIMIGGFTLSGSPIGLLRKLSELPITGLTAISEDCGYIRDDVKRKNQNEFLEGKTMIMVATNSFGLGIDHKTIKIKELSREYHR